MLYELACISHEYELSIFQSQTMRLSSDTSGNTVSSLEGSY